MDRLLAAEHLNFKTKFVSGCLRIGKIIIHRQQIPGHFKGKRGLNCRVISLFPRAKRSQNLPVNLF